MSGHGLDKSAVLSYRKLFDESEFRKPLLCANFLPNKHLPKNALNFFSTPLLAIHLV